MKNHITKLHKNKKIKKLKIIPVTRMKIARILHGDNQQQPQVVKGLLCMNNIANSELMGKRCKQEEGKQHLHFPCPDG